MTTQQIDEQLEVLRTTQIELMSGMIKNLADAVKEHNESLKVIARRLDDLEADLANTRGVLQ